MCREGTNVIQSLPYIVRRFVLYKFLHTIYIHVFIMYHRAGNFREVYISRSLRFDRICESLSREFVNITIQTHNTSTQIAKLKLQKCLFECEIAKFCSVNIFHSTVHMCTLQVEASLPFPAYEELHGTVIAGQTTHMSSTCKFYNVCTYVHAPG